MCICAWTRRRPCPPIRSCSASGATQPALREEFPDLRTLPSMWTRSYYVSTAPAVSRETVGRYIEAQTRR